jgi:hypothetical protein
VKRKYYVYLVQTLGLLCMAAALYLGWVQQLAADAAAIREALTEPQLTAQAAAAWHGFPESVLLTLRGPVFWLGLAIVVAAPWLPIPDSRGRGPEVPAREGRERVVEPPAPVTEPTESRAGAARPTRKARPKGSATRVLDPPAPHV